MKNKDMAKRRESFADSGVAGPVPLEKTETGLPQNVKPDGKGSISPAPFPSMRVRNLMEKIRKRDEAMAQSKPSDRVCNECGENMAPKWDLYSGSWQYPDFDASSGICRTCHRLKEIGENIDIHLARAGVPLKYIGCSFETFMPLKQFEVAFNLCRGYLQNPVYSLFIYGKFGTGKTHMAVAITRELLLQGRQVMFTSVPRLLFEIRKDFKENARDTEALYVEKYSSFEFLVLDDFGVEKTTEWARQTLDYIIYERDNNLRPMVITSNLSLDEVAEKIDGRISSRLAGMGRIVHFNGPDFRLKRNGSK